MKLIAILSKKNNDEVRSKLLSTQTAQIVLDIYDESGNMPSIFAELIKKYFDKDFEVEIK